MTLVLVDGTLARDPLGGPARQRHHTGLLRSILGQLQVTAQPNHHRDRSGPCVAKDRCEFAQPGISTINGRTSMEP